MTLLGQHVHFTIIFPESVTLNVPILESKALTSLPTHKPQTHLNLQNFCFLSSLFTVVQRIYYNLWKGKIVFIVKPAVVFAFLCFWHFFRVFKNILEAKGKQLSTTYWKKPPLHCSVVPIPLVPVCELVLFCTLFCSVVLL